MRQPIVQNKDVANCMREFFQGLKWDERREPKWVASAYGGYMWDKRSTKLIEGKNASRSRFYVGLSTSNDDLSDLTKRVALVSDTLLLSHHVTLQGRDPKAFWDHRSEWKWMTRWKEDWRRAPSPSKRAIRRIRHGHFGRYVEDWVYAFRPPGYDPTDRQCMRMYCADETALGEWILKARPLLTAGLAWYLPTYVTGIDETPALEGAAKQLTPADYLVDDGRAVDASGAEPLKSKLVRPILSIDLPFVEGVDLANFSRITIDEFDSYSGFRDFLRQSLLGLDDALSETHTEQALVKIGLEIADQIRSVRAEMNKARHKRAVAASGAAIGATGAMLVAVYGPALQAAIATVGATGGLWGIIHAMAENSPRHLRDDKWYYAWALSRQGRRS